MELNSQTNVFTKGLDLDSDVSIIPEGAYRYAENIRLITNNEGTTGALQNIEHIRKYTESIPEDETIIGTSNTLLYDDDLKHTYEVGVVITKKTVNDQIYNTVYIIKGFDTVDIETIAIVKGYLELDRNLNIVTNYESNNASNIYITDGLTPIKVINIIEQLLHINSGTFAETLDPTRFDLTPGCVLIPFSFQQKINGVLPVGAVQYAYQLFNIHGGETAVSSLSEVIPISRQASSTKAAKGGIKGEISNMGCQIKAQFQNDGRFDRMRIFSIVYLDNTSVPNVYIANEIVIPNNKENEFVTCTYNDTGNNYIAQITIDEFNAMTPYEFTATSIEKLLNRLFAANIQEYTWDVEFDARAYRSNKNGAIELHSVEVSNNIAGTLNPDGKIYSNGVEIKVSEEHDCINPSNVNVTLNDQTYTYNPKINQRGGLGPNVSYRFTYTPLVLSQSTTAENELSTSLDADCSQFANRLTTYYEDGTICKIVNVPNGTIIPNYSDPYVCANYLGYQRDEIYRFGIILYNNKNIPSPVHWIGDIKMPATYSYSYPSYVGKSEYNYPFHCGDVFNNNMFEMVAYALGIEFTVNNLPEEVYAYEIVRCDRTAADRTVICQGALGATIAFDTWGEYTHNYGSIDTRPLPHLMLPEKFYGKSYWLEENQWGEANIRKNCFEFASPEICISKDSAIQMLSSSYLMPLYYASSYYLPATADDLHPIPGIPPQKLYAIDGSGTIINNIFYTTNFPTMYRDTSYGIMRYDWLGLDGEGDSERALLCKYYITENTNRLPLTPLEITDAIITRPLPFYRKEHEAKNYLQFVGDYAFVNAATIVGGNFNHGICAVITTDTDFTGFIDNTKTLNVSTVPVKNEYNTTAICNIKRNIIPYGGNAYINRQSSIYQSCGCMCSENMDQPQLCFGGDTYLCIFDYQNTVIQSEENDIAAASYLKTCIASYIPLETVINLNLRSDESFSKKVDGNVAPNQIQLEPTTFQNYVQDEPLYIYNSVYSQTSGSKMYVPKGVYAEDDAVNNCRIVYSEAKTNNELLDHWTKFKVANYLDVDARFGPITNLKVFKGRLYYWQNQAVGIAAVNERSLITDNNSAALTLGTGDILSRYDYVTEKNGSSIINDKSIVASDHYLYWYDLDKNVLCQMGNGINHLSKSLNVQSYLNSLEQSQKTNAVSFYDHKYNEVWFRLHDKSLIYNEKLNVFTSFYTHNPNWFFPFSDKLITIKDNNMYYLHNTYKTDGKGVEDRISKVLFVVNKEITNTKVFDNVMFTAEFTDDKNFIPTVIKGVLFKTKTQETESIDYSNIEVREDNYRFPISREKVNNEQQSTIASKSYLGRMRGKYLICDYTFDCNENREFKIPFIKTTYRYSML